MPISKPKPTSAANVCQTSAAPIFSDASAAVRNMSRNGTAIPSFSPASTFRVWRMRTGTFLLCTTCLPKPASVGARTVPRMAASQIDRSAKRTAAAIAPNPIVSGRPMASIRAGRSFPFSTLSFMRAESLNRIKARASSPRTSNAPASTATSIRPRAGIPTMRPEDRKTMAEDKMEVRRRREASP